MTLIRGSSLPRESASFWRLAVLLAALLAVFVSSLLFLAGAANADNGIQVSITSTDDYAFPTIRITLAAEQAGLPIASANASALSIQQDGKPVTINSVQTGTASDQPLAVVLAVDTSGSMAGAKLTSVQQSAVALINSLGPSDSAALIGFADKVTVLQPLTTDKGALTAAIQKLSAGGNTALYDAVARSSQMAAQSGLARRAVILMTDGEDFGGISQLSRDASLADLRSGGALFYSIGVGSEIDQQYLQDVASQSGGKFFAALTPTEIPGIYASLQQLLRSQIVVTFKSPLAAAAGNHTISVVLNSNGASASATRSYSSMNGATAPSVTAVAQTVAVAKPAAATSTAPKKASSKGGVPGWLLALIGLGAVLAGGTLIWLGRRRAARHRRDWTAPAEALQQEPLPTTSPLGAAQAVERQGRFVLSVAGTGTSVALGDTPILIGTGSDCDLQLPEQPGIARDHARVWLRDGRPMVHHLARGYETVVNNTPSEWASFGPDDRLEIGPFTIHCIDRQAPPVGSTAGLA